MTIHKTVFCCVLATVVLLGHGTAQAATIKKCQDAQGRWHYGDQAARECQKSRADVIEFSSKTGAQKVIEAPPTKEELDARKAEAKKNEDDKRVAAERAAQDKMLMQQYAVEDDIIFERNRKIKELQSAIESQEATVTSLRAVLARAEDTARDDGKGSAQSRNSAANARTQVERHEAALEEKRRELEAVKQEYDHKLERYREARKGSR
jgi:disulfide oxidoreductase YuzD